MNQSINFEKIKSQLLADKKLLADLYNRFDPSRPLRDDHPAYVNCQDVRGDNNILNGIGKRIVTEDKPASCYLYTGHRGGGKSTELYRLKSYLEKNDFFVIYLNSDEYLDLQNVQHTDILLACTHRIIEELEKRTSIRPNALFKWLKERGKELINFGLSEVDIQNLNLSFEQQAFPGSKIVANIKTSPSNREKIRKQVEEHIITFKEALNEFIEEAQQKRPSETSKLVVIVDNLDRIPIVKRNSDGSNNHDELFIDKNAQLKSLNCHLIYTVPISLVYSRNAPNLWINYDGNTEVLPMIIVQDKEGNVHQAGIDTIKELIQKRIDYAVDKVVKKQYSIPIDNQIPSILLLEDIFDETATLDRLCRVTGGHLREVMFLMQESINFIEKLPVTRREVEKAIATSRNAYENAVDHQDWGKLAEIAKSKRIDNEEKYRQLLFSRCVLEYREVDSRKKWHDVHPLIKEIDDFQEACQRLKENRGKENG